MTRWSKRARIGAIGAILIGAASSGLAADADVVTDLAGETTVVAVEHLYLPGDDETMLPVNLIEGTDLEFVNREAALVPHALTSVAMVEDADGNEVPLFDSGILNPSQSSVVDTSSLPPGDYAFFCLVHGIRQMSGTLRVVPAP